MSREVPAAQPSHQALCRIPVLWKNLEVTPKGKTHKILLEGPVGTGNSHGTLTKSVGTPVALPPWTILGQMLWSAVSRVGLRCSQRAPLKTSVSQTKGEIKRFTGWSLE